MIVLLPEQGSLTFHNQDKDQVLYQTSFMGYTYNHEKIRSGM